MLGGAQPGGPAMRAIIHDIGAGLTLAPGDIALAVTELGLTSGLGGNTPSSEPWPVWAAGLTWLLGRRRGRRVYLTARGDRWLREPSIRLALAQAPATTLALVTRCLVTALSGALDSLR